MESILTHDRLVVRQDFEETETFSGIEQENTCRIESEGGERLGVAQERSTAAGRWLRGDDRSVSLLVRPVGGGSYLTLEKRTEWLRHTLEVYGPGRRLLGTVRQSRNPLKPSFTVADGAGTPYCTLEGSLLTGPDYACLREGRKVSTISKTFAGGLAEAFTDADVFCLEFPPDAGGGARAVLLGAVFLIDYAFHEGRG